ncbi:MAG: hypothetical protein FWH21_02510 [Kiritimatiellaeota bacterium]|nr:hypothetical protein [Kiritimatiellota bacterium]
MRKLWQRNYYEHVIRNAESHECIARYVAGNPVNWVIDKFHCGDGICPPASSPKGGAHDSSD